LSALLRPSKYLHKGSVQRRRRRRRRRRERWFAIITTGIRVSDHPAANHKGS